MTRAFSPRGRPASPRGTMGRYRVTDGGSSSASFHHYRADRYRPQYHHSTSVNRRSRPICWDCGTPGHTWRHCQQPINHSCLERRKPIQTNGQAPRPQEPKKEPNHSLKIEPNDRETPPQIEPPNHNKYLVDCPGRTRAIESLKAYLARIVLHGIEDARALNSAHPDEDEDAPFQKMAVDLITDGLVSSWIGVLSSTVLMSVNDTLDR